MALRALLHLFSFDKEKTPSHNPVAVEPATFAQLGFRGCGAVNGTD